MNKALENFCRDNPDHTLAKNARAKGGHSRAASSYAMSDSEIKKRTAEFFDNLEKQQQDSPPEFDQVRKEDFRDLLA